MNGSLSPFSRQNRWYALGLTAVFGLASVYNIHRALMVLLFDGTHTATLIKSATGRFVPLDNTIASFLVENQFSIVYSLDAFLVKTFGLSPVTVEMGLGALLTLASVGMFLLAATRVLDDFRLGAVAFLIVTVSMLPALPTGAAYSFWRFSGVLGLMTQGMVVMIWAAWMLVSASRRNLLFISALNGLFFNVHAGQSLCFEGVFLIWLGWSAWEARPRGRALLTLGLACLVWFLCALPTFVPALGNVSNVVPDMDLIWSLIKVRKAGHLTPWRTLPGLLALQMLVLTAWLAMRASRERLDRETFTKLAACVVASTLMLCVSVAGVEWLHSLFIARLSLNRALTFTILATGIMVVSLMKGEACPSRAAPVLSLMPAAGVPWQAAIPLVLFLVKPVGRENRWPSGWALAALGSGLILIGVSLSRGSWDGWVGLAAFPVAFLLARNRPGGGVVGKGTAVALCFTLLAIKGVLFGLPAVGYLWPEAGKEGIFSSRLTRTFHSSVLDELEGLGEWAEANTGKDSLFLCPPYPGFMSGRLSRTSLFDAKEFGTFILNPASAPLEAEMIETIFGSRVNDVRHMGKYWNNYKFYLEVEYIALLKDPGRVLALKRRWPRLRYLVGFTPGAKLPEASWLYVDQFDGPLLPFRIVYSNGLFTVYELPS